MIRRRRSQYEAVLDLAARRGPVVALEGSEVTDRLAPGDEPAQERRRSFAAGQAVPPEGVHAMTRGVEHVAGGMRHADLVAAALRAAGAAVPERGAALDFGCSSGRVVRALAAAFPEVRWHGADPNAGAIAWAAENVRGVEFLAGPPEPPLPFDGGSLALVVAISIWSHYGAGLAAAWLDEMHRAVAPGGHLVLTFHGTHSLAFFARERARGPDVLAAAARGLYETGHHFHDEFGARGDEGVRHPEWGLAFCTLEWLAAATAGRWDVALHAPGAADGNQDVAVLARRGPG